MEPLSKAINIKAGDSILIFLDFKVGMFPNTPHSLAIGPVTGIISLSKNLP